MRHQEVTLAIPSTPYFEFEDCGITVFLLSYNHFFANKLLTGSGARSSLADLIQKDLLRSPYRLHPVHLAFLIRWHGIGVYESATGLSKSELQTWVHEPKNTLSLANELYVRNVISHYFQMTLREDLKERREPHGDPPIPFYIDAADWDSISNWSVVPSHLFAQAVVTSKE